MLRDIGRQLLSMGISGLTGGFGRALGLPGFDEGGYTGVGGKHQPAGMVHKGEYVFSKQATQRAGVGNLDAMHRSLKGYADGGTVGLTLPRIPRPANDNGGIVVNYSPQIDNRGADIAAVARLEQAMARDRAELEGRVKEVVKGRGTKWR